MHFLGLNGMPRRIYTYSEAMGWQLWNLVSTVGAFLLATSLLLFIIVAIRAMRNGFPAGNDPWDARTLEWSVSSPPPGYNFRRLPRVTGLDAFWSQKQRPTSTDDHLESEVAIHMPGPSVYPALCAFGMLMGAYGVLYSGLVAIAGVMIAIVSIYGWAFEGVGGAILEPEEERV
jgi:cytochrome c oxidase subunit 1